MSLYFTRKCIEKSNAMKDTIKESFNLLHAMNNFFNLQMQQTIVKSTKNALFPTKKGFKSLLKLSLLKESEGNYPKCNVSCKLVNENEGNKLFQKSTKCKSKQKSIRTDSTFQNIKIILHKVLIMTFLFSSKTATRDITCLLDASDKTVSDLMCYLSSARARISHLIKIRLGRKDKQVQIDETHWFKILKHF